MAKLPAEKNRRILLIDDNRAIHEDFRKILAPASRAAIALDEAEEGLFGKPVRQSRYIQYEIDSAYQGQDALKQVRQALDEGRPYAMAFVDIRMPPGWDGVETTQKIWEIDPDIQIVLCTAYADYSWDDMFERIGNHDGLLILKKPFDNVEVLQMAHALTEKWWLHRQEQRKMEELEHMVAARTGELQWKTASLEAQVHSSLDGILVVDERGKKILQNQKVADLFKIPPHIADDKDDGKQRRWLAGTTKDPEQFLERVADLYAHPNEISRDELELKDGTTLDRYSSPVFGKDGKYYGRIWTFRDMTGRKRLEAQLFQSQKMETVGKLAGGIAHEFNSILTAILGHSQLLMEDLPADSPLIQNASEINKAAGRVASLTRQLLAFGRKQFLQQENLDLNTVLVGMENTLSHLMGRGVEVRFVAGAGTKPVKADPAQIEQVIINIVMNAADVMPNGGKLTLETANVSFDEQTACLYPELKPGNYVMLAITDTGTGMSDEVRARVFEPFFTTKAVGEGTGLGLSTCYGIIKQSGGHISVYSESGRGTTFKICLPQAESPEKISVQPHDAHDLPRGTESILLVEDNTALREMSATLLARLGYAVFAAANGVEALSLSEKPGTGKIDLLFTDVVMPKMSGKELAENVRTLYPHTRILFTSAFTENALIHQGVIDKSTALLQKPFVPSALAHKLREVLDAKPPKPA